MAGRPGLPVTSWAPEAVDGHRRRPTLLSNAESYAHLAAVVLWGVDGYAAHGTPEEPGTSLLTLTTPPAADGVFRGVHVVEVEHGDGAARCWTPPRCLAPARRRVPRLVGAPPGRGRPAVVDGVLGEVGARLGAGALLSLSDGSCPVAETARYTPTSPVSRPAAAARAATGCPPWPPRCGRSPTVPTPAPRLRELAGLVTGRGACAHPDGTARLVGSLLTTLERPRRGAPRPRLRVPDPASGGRRVDGTRRGGAAMSPRETVLQVDWPQCRARGLCAELFPEKIQLDEWGYPVVLGPVREGERALALAHRADDDGVAPLVEEDPLREQLGAEPPGPALWPVDAQGGRGRAHETTASRPERHAHARSRWLSTWSPSPVSSEVTSRAVPSGWAQAPRPRTSPVSSRMRRRVSARSASARTSSASAGSPLRQGPQRPADSAARYAVKRAV